jgi:predicted nucleotidyltransferase
MISLNYYLKRRSSELFIKYDSEERKKIDSSIRNIKEKLAYYFGSNITLTKEFGSYKRGTILPRRYDSRSDVDLLIIFDRTNGGYHPITYRKWLHEFAQKYYPQSISKKDQPSVVLDLQFIRYDLVPCYTEESWLSGRNYYIPQDNNSWRKSDIDGFSEKLSQINKQCNSIVKPTVRLLKAWNAKVGHPIPSYELAQEIAEINFFGDDHHSAFFHTIRRLNEYRNSDYVRNRVLSLKDNAKKVETYLQQDNRARAMNWLSRIVPT